MTTSPHTSNPQPTESRALATTLPAARWFWQRSLQNRIVLTYGTLLVLTLLTLGIYVGREVYRVQLEQAEHDQEVSAFLIANALEDPLSGYPHALERYGVLMIEEESDGNTLLGGAPSEEQRTALQMVTEDPALAVSFQDFVQLYKRGETARVTLLAINGDVIADSLFPPQQLPNQLTQIEIAAALRGAEQHDIRIDPETGVSTLYAAAPVQQGRLLLGVVRVARPIQDVVRPTQLFLLNLSIGGVIALILITVIGVGLSRYLVRPLHELEETAQRIAQGELHRIAPVHSADEVGALAVSFNGMVAQLRTLIEQQRQFVANASHELRTPLTNIKLRSEAVLAMEETLSPRAKRYVAEIDSEADRLRRLANTLLNLASIEHQSQTLPTEPTDIAPLLFEIVRTFQLAAQQAGIVLRAQVPNQLPVLRIWPDHLIVIANNLFDNAIKYTPNGGEVSFTVTVTATTCTLHIQNDGAVIPAADLPYIFERFYRVDKARSRQTKVQGVGSGAGLGLAIVKTVVELNQGEVTVTSTAQQGTRFVVAFPCAVPMSPSTQSSSSAPTSR